jgi:hypothetical protein
MNYSKATSMKQAECIEKNIQPNPEKQAAQKRQKEQYKLVYPAMEKMRKL